MTSSFACARRSQPASRVLLLALLLSGLAAARPALAAVTPPFTFCYGLERGGSPAVMRDLGLNTLYIDLRPSDVADLEPCRRMIRDAQRNGLRVVIGLPTCLTSSYRVSPWDEEYTGSVRELVTYLVSQLKTEQGVSAWGTGHSLEKSLSYSDADFRLYLQAGYPTLDALNAWWGAQFVTWQQITMQGAREVDAKWPFRVGRASVDLADYHGYAYREVMKRWLLAIRALDTTRPVLTGRITLYRSLAVIPEGYDIVCVSMPPDVVETDLVAHNVHALDLARRGGKFHVLPVLRVPSNASPAYGAESLRDWISHGAMHGAVGFGLEDWALLGSLYDTERSQPNPKWRRAINAVSSCRDLKFDFVPQPSSAIVFSPYAEGLQVTRQPLYGFMLDYLPGEPSGLVYGLRLGTRYGVLDYLTLEDLLDLDLRRYGSLLLPACLKLPRPQQAVLDDYVQRGGTALADLGLGMYETGSWTGLPEAFAAAAGILQLSDLKDRAADLTPTVAVPGLPALPRGLKSEGTFTPGGAAGTAADRRTYTVGGPVAEVQLTEDAAPIATAGVRFDANRKPIFAGLVGRRSGAGVALFATHALWQHWPLSDALSQALHAGLLSLRAQFELLQGGLLPSSLCLSGNDREVRLFNGDRQATTAQLWAYRAQSRAYAGAVSNFVANPLQQGLPDGAALLVAAFPAQQITALPRSSLLVQPYRDDVTVQLNTYSAREVSMQLGGAGAVVSGSPNRGLEIRGGSAVQVRLLLGSGAYPVAPRSTHRVITRARGSRDVSHTLVANERGELDLSGVYRTETITVTPMP